MKEEVECCVSIGFDDHVVFLAVGLVVELRERKVKEEEHDV